MCLGIPMRVKRVDNLVARCEAKGVEREVSLMLMHDEEVVPGDYLVMQGGYATGKLSEQQALDAWALYDEMLRAETQIEGE